MFQGLYYKLFFLKQRLLLSCTDVVIASYPKTGGTWLQLLLRALLIKHLDLIDDPKHDVFVNDLRNMKRKQVGFPRLYFTHAMPGFNDDPYHKVTVEHQKFKYHKNILLTRNPKDTLVSLYFHNCYRSVPPAYKGDINAMVYDDIFGIQKYIHFYSAWVKDGNNNNNILILRYEDLHANTIFQLKRIATFLEMENIAEDTFHHVVAACAFDKMKAAETADSDLPGLNRSKNLSQEAFKVREGKVGGYKKHLSEEAISYIDECVRLTLPKIYGY